MMETGICGYQCRLRCGTNASKCRIFMFMRAKNVFIDSVLSVGAIFVCSAHNTWFCLLQRSMSILDLVMLCRILWLRSSYCKSDCSGTKLSHSCPVHKLFLPHAHIFACSWPRTMLPRLVIKNTFYFSDSLIQSFQIVHGLFVILHNL